MQSKEDLQKIADTYEGVLFLSAIPGSPADRAGMVAGDVILSVNGERTKTLGDYLMLVVSDDHPKKPEMVLEIMRDHKPMRVVLDLSAAPVDRDVAVQHVISEQAYVPFSDKDPDLN